MKALAILNLIKNNDIKVSGILKDDIFKAIDELQDLLNRSCENCKYNKEQDNFMIFCDKVMCQDGSKMMWHSFTKDFSCKFWEVNIGENFVEKTKYLCWICRMESSNRR